ncbi:lytic transglycosylase domain-containing protein [Nocardioides aurantiacus]|uniref:lytic transglycosylase domain-containing protein n=1 Tax=Nocardioides aurantiacus TaxID=86796 RepID=UPI001B885A87|nr:lytic transglycosylase domain-containing protein [Nocardioides aurantiacus]
MARHEVTAVDTRAPAVELRPSANSHGATLGSTALDPRGIDDLHPDLHRAYWLAVQSAPAGCHPGFTLLAAIGMVESGNAAGRHIDSDHRVAPSLVGPPLDGVRRPVVSDSDAGQLDGDRRWDRALGPLQLVPEVWRAAGVDMDGDGVRDPQNVFDAAGAAVVYLCAGSRDLATTVGVRRAILSYNRSPGYLTAVLDWKDRYDRQRKHQMTPPTLIGTPSDGAAARPGPDGIMTPAAHHGAPPRAATSPSSSVTAKGPSRADVTPPDVHATPPVPLVAQPPTPLLTAEPRIPSAAPGPKEAPGPSPAATPSPTGAQTEGDMTGMRPSPTTTASPAPSPVPVCALPTEDLFPVDVTVSLLPEVELCDDEADVGVMPPS